MRISDWSSDACSSDLTQGVDDSAPETLFPAAAAALDALGIAFLELREPGPDGTFGRTDVPRQSPAIRTAFQGPLIPHSAYHLAQAAADLARGLSDAVSFGRPLICHPARCKHIPAGPGCEAISDRPGVCKEW